MPIQRHRGIIGSLWILDFVVLGLLVAPMNDGASLLIALGLWAVPTLLLGFLTWRHRHSNGRPDGHQPS